MGWLNEQTTLLHNHGFNEGKTRLFRNVLLCDFARDIKTLVALKALNPQSPDYKERKKPLKAKLQCWAPGCLFQSRAAGHVIITKRTSLLQLDFDYEAIRDYDIEEVKAVLFSLPFVAFVSLSCTCDGCFALIQIAEPEKLALYCEHLFTVLIEDYGIKPDTTKGTNATDLRYVSYDPNMLIRENPEALYLTSFRSRNSLMQKPVERKQYITTGEDIRSQVEQLINCLHQSGTDITASYAEWVQVGFALATEFGEGGRTYYHDISSVNGGYRPAECDRQYSNCVRGKRTGVTLRTLFHLAKNAGIIIHKQSSLATA